MTAFDRVMAQPASLAARYALLEEWKASGNPQAVLLEKQLEYRQYAGIERRAPRAQQLDLEIERLTLAKGRAWAGRVAELVKGYKFYRGLVAEVHVSGERFLEVMPEVFALQPVQHVYILEPYGSIEAISKSPLLAKLSTLRIEYAGDAVGDAGAIAIANSPHVANLVDLALVEAGITKVGAEAIVASPYLARAKHVDLSDNPYDPTPAVIDAGDGVLEPHRSPVADDLEAKYGVRPWLAAPTGYLPTWPGWPDEIALIHDYVEDDQLARLEELAVAVDQLAAGDEDQQITAGAKRQRLLIELDVYGLLSGQPEIGKRVADYKTLRAYHDACVQMSSYHASAARIRLVGNAIPIKPTDGHVSLDWFRTPSGYAPYGVSPHDWLALCEANFIDPLPEKTGTRYIRLNGKTHALSYRIEATGEPKLWRVDLA